MNPISKLLILAGTLLILAGLWFNWKGRIPLPLGRLPLDFHIQRDHFSFYFPLGSCLLISAVWALLSWWLKR